jgi:toxin ParE1/3/4
MARPDRRLIWSQPADTDLLDIWGYLAEQASPDIADRQLRNIVTACDRLVTWPFSGRPRNELVEGMRSIVVHPYLVFYRPSDAAVEIVRVLHGRRDLDAIFADD